MSISSLLFLELSYLCVSLSPDALAAAAVVVVAAAAAAAAAAAVRLQGVDDDSAGVGVLECASCRQERERETIRKN